MYSLSQELLTKTELQDALKIVRDSKLGVRHTPCILASNTHQDKTEKDNGLDFFDSCHLEHESLFAPLPTGARIFLKLENLQRTGSFKIRGVSVQINQFVKRFSGKDGKCDKKFVTMSAGNYGRTVAYAAHKLGLEGTVIMPLTAPENRSTAIKNYGIEVERMPSAELCDAVERHEKDHGSIYLHSIDDLTLIAGHASLGFEIVDDVPDVDIVLVCCGGGGLIAGTAAAINALKPGTKIYGVEPATACGVHMSFQAGKAVKCPEAKSIASGLAPPFAGENAFRHIKEYVRGIILVTEDELKAGVDVAYRHGLVVEPAGAAALAALLSGKLLEKEGSLEGKTVVVVLTGGNVTPNELINIL